MKLKLLVSRNGISIYAGIYTVSDAESFGVACSDLWEKLTALKIAKARNVGALYDALEDSMAADLKDLRIQLVPLDP
jgi:hypothetical protein